MELNKFTTGIIFVDDIKEQVQKLMNYCSSKGIKTLYINPNDLVTNNLYLGYRIVFVDLAFDNGVVDVPRVTNIIRAISENGEKHLLIVAWTQHEDDIESLKNKIEEKMPSNLPIAILNAKKSKVLYAESDDAFNNLISNIFDEFEEQNKNLFNLLEWQENYLKAVREEFNILIEKSYSNKIDSKLIDKNLGIFVGNTLMPDKILSAFEILNIKVSDNVLSKINSMNNYDFKYVKESIAFTDKFKFNYEMLFERKKSNINIPGSLYKINDYSYNNLKKLSLAGKNSENMLIDDLFAALCEKEIQFDYIYQIALNITPNCTFASKSKNTTYCQGFLIIGVKDYENNYKKLKNLKNYSYNCQDICMFSYINEENIFSHLIVRFDICTNDIYKQYEKIGQLKNNIKVNIQQKFSAWINRVGDNIYY